MDARSLCPEDESPCFLQTLLAGSQRQRWLCTCPRAPLSPHRTLFSPDNRATCGVENRIPKAAIWHLRSYPHASFASITDLHSIGAHATGLQVRKMFSTWSATDTSSTVASRNSPVAKRRRISESTHGRRTSKATRACDVCKVNVFLLVSNTLRFHTFVCESDVAPGADGCYHYTHTLYMPCLLWKIVKGI